MRRRVFLASAAGVPLSFGAGQTRSRAFKRSDVVFSFRFTPPEYQAYHATVLFGWAGAPATSDEIPKYREYKRQSLAVGVREGASISGFFGGTAWLKEREGDWQESVWRNRDGNLITYPWVRPPEPFPPEKGEVCTNHPRFLEKKFAETDLAMAVQPYAFHVDDPLGTATELRIQGCFCKHCIAGFRTYLNEHTARDVTRAAGIGDLESFDYAKFLKGRSDRPLWYEWENFQLRSSVEHIRKIRQYAIRKRGESIPFGANAPVTGAHIVFAPDLDYIAAEVGTDAADRKFGGKPLLNYKMGEALGVAVAATGIYRDWVMLTNHDIPDLVRGWIAESYACGGNFIVPHKEWGFVQPPGEEPKSTAYPAKPEHFAPIYKFVRDYSSLFDDYEAVTQVGLLYDYRAARLGGSAASQMPQTPDIARPAELHEICLALANAQVPFGMVVAGSEPLEHNLTLADLERFERVIVTGPVMVEGPQKRALDTYAARGKLISWSGVDQLRLQIEPLVRVNQEGLWQDGLWVLPRRIPGRQSAPFACHVLNRAFDPRAEHLIPRRDIKLDLRRSLFEGRRHFRCRLLQERQSPRDLKVASNGDFVTVVIPELELWGVLEFG